jgi:hypothetical protein
MVELIAFQTDRLRMALLSPTGQLLCAGIVLQVSGTGLQIASESGLSFEQCDPIADAIGKVPSPVHSS